MGWPIWRLATFLARHEADTVASSRGRLDCRPRRRTRRLEFFAGCSAESLAPLAAQLRPLAAAPGQVLMRQGERGGLLPAHRFRAGEVTHTGDDGEIHRRRSVARPDRRRDRVAARRPAHRDGDRDRAADRLGRRPGGVRHHARTCRAWMDRLVRTARQRLAAFVTPDSGHAARRHRAVPAAGVARRQRAHRARAGRVLQRDAVPALPVDADSHPVADGLSVRGGLRRPLRLGGDRRSRRAGGGRRAVRPRRDTIPPLAEVAFIVGDDYRAGGSARS